MVCLFSNLQLNSLLLFSLLFCFSSINPSPLGCHNEDYIALLQFKQEIPFNRSAPFCRPLTESWVGGTDCCTWGGVGCDSKGHVESRDLSSTCLYGTLPSNSSLFNLVHLRFLSLSGNDFRLSPISPSFGRLRNLTHLDLSSSNFGSIPSEDRRGNFSDSIFHLPNLVSLDLSGNTKLTGKIPSFNGSSLLQELRSLYLSYTGLSGEIPDSIGQLKELRSLDLSDTALSGEIPDSIGHLKELRYLYLSDTALSGEIPDSIGHLKELRYLDLSLSMFSGSIPRSLGNLTLLTHLLMYFNNFSGKLPSSLSGLENLQLLGLSDNNFSGQISQLFGGKLDTSLKVLFLDGNSLSGQLPPSLFDLVGLNYLFLSSNNFSGIVEWNMLTKLSGLSQLDLSNSGLSVNTNSDHLSTFTELSTLRLSSCNLSKIPTSIKTPNNLTLLDLSNNKLDEELNPWICDLDHLIYLDLSSNHFHGVIPTCLGYSSEWLSVINLRSNSFHGTIPESFGYASNLSALDISYNGLEGVIPTSLVNCTKLEVLNLGHNLIADVFPFWLENLPLLQVLVLRMNRFYGSIGQPRSKSAFTNLSIIDLSHNHFTGTLPDKYFRSWHSMMATDEDALTYMQDRNYQFYSVTIMNKGLEMVYVRIITTLKVVDLSFNKFDGKIPASIGRLTALRVLNFSRNGLTGPIPLPLVKLTKLESLDLSKNKLSGEIPPQLTSLTFLEVLDVSQNNLTGLIPQGGQFGTFSNTSYEGNPSLCGIPLSKKCGEVKTDSPTLPSSKSHNFKFEVDGFGWEIVLIGYGCGLVIGLVIGSWIFRRREEWLVRIFGVKIRQPGKRSN